MVYNPELLQFSSTDGLALPALLYTPSQPSKKAVIYLHGNGSSSVFYDAEQMNTLAMKFNNHSIAFFPFNNRGAHYIQSFSRMEHDVKTRTKYGTTYELIKDCVYDIDGAVHYLSDRGYEELYLIGISTGANKICVYNHYRQHNKISKYILLSGGDDTGLYYQMMGEKKFKHALEQSLAMIQKGRGQKMVPHYMVNYLFSYQSLYDTINPDGDYNVFPFNEYMNNLKLSSQPLFHMYKELKKPTLVIYGEQDEYCYGDVPRCVEILKSQTKGKDNVTYSIIPQADHGFNGKEHELGNSIVSWLVT